MSRLLRALAVLPLIAAAPLAAQSIVRNQGFAVDVSGWTADGGFLSVAWSSLDAAGLGGSGSAVLANSAAAPRSTGGISQCVAVVPGVTYPGRVLFRAPSGQAATGSVRAAVELYANGGCSGTPISSFANSASVGSTFDTWIALVIGDVLVPAAASSALVTLAVSKDQAGGTFRAAFDDVTLGPLLTLTIPASASLHGQNGAFFHTDVWVVNTAPGLAQTLRLRHRCFSGPTCGGAEQVVLVNARASRLFSDVLASLFGDAETAGALEVSYESAVGRPTILARTYSPSLPEPTTGSALPAVPASQAGTRTVLAGLGGSGGSLALGFRSNVGAYNPGDAPVTVTFELHGGNGALLGSFNRTLGAREPAQVNDVFTAAGAAASVTANAYAIVSAAAPVFSYATVIDNQSGDSVIVLGEPEHP